MDGWEVVTDDLQQLNTTPSPEKPIINEQKWEDSIDFGKFEQLSSFIANTDDIKTITLKVTDYVKSILKEFWSESDIKFLYDPANSINDYTADQIYNSISKNKIKNLVLIIHSRWGSIEPAYLISKCFKQFSENFIVIVPRLAKSAATLISLGANEIHMGQMSQLGPIDPQIWGLPALGLGNAVEYLAAMCKKYPEASKMLAQYLSFELDLSKLWTYERISESAVQYAERLLDNKQLPTNLNAHKVASDLVYSYKDHGFVIDYEEAKKHLGDIIKINTDQYKIADKIHRFLDNVELTMLFFKKKQISIIGSIDNGLRFSDKKKD